MDGLDKQERAAAHDGADEPVIPIGRYPCLYLVLALVALLAGYPYLTASVDERIALNLVNVVVMVAAVTTVRRRRAPLLRAAGVAAAVLGLQIWNLLSPSALAYLLLALAMSALYAIVLVNLLAYLLRSGPITADKLYAGIAGYLLIGIFYGAAFAVLQDLRPDAFALDPSLHAAADFQTFLYVSFGTLTSAGYGGLTPVLPQARSLLILEEVSGFVYAALLIARLTSLYRSRG
jgi:hypothetical protein